MESAIEKRNYFRSVSDMMVGSYLAFDNSAKPFCMWGWVLKDGVPCDLSLVYFNKAFKDLVNGKAKEGLKLSDIAPDKVNFWVECFWPLESCETEVCLQNYVTSDKKHAFAMVMANKVDVLGQHGIGIVFLEASNSVDVALTDAEVDMLKTLYPDASLVDALKMLIREKCSLNISQGASAAKVQSGF